MKYIGLILAYGLIHAAANWWQTHTQSGMMFRHYCVNFKTDWVTGVGLAFVIVVGSMVAAIYAMRWHLGYY